MSLAPQLAPKLAEKPTKYYISKGITELNKKFTSSTGSRRRLTNHEIKYITKRIKSLVNTGILLKGTTTKISSQKEGSFNFLRPLMSAGLPADAALRKTIYGSGCPSDLASCRAALKISNEEMEDIMKIVKSLEESVLSKSELVKEIKDETKEQKGEFFQCYYKH